MSEPYSPELRCSKNRLQRAFSLYEPSVVPLQLLPLLEMHQSVLAKMDHLGQLQATFQQKQQQSFVGAMVTIMDQFSTELNAAHEMYHQIDKQIEDDPKCQVLQAQLRSFKERYLHLKEQAAQDQAAYEKERERNRLLKQENERLQKGVKGLTKKEWRDRIKRTRASLQFGKSDPPLFASDETAFRSRSMQTQQVLKIRKEGLRDKRRNTLETLRGIRGRDDVESANLRSQKLEGSTVAGKSRNRTSCEIKRAAQD